MCNDFSCIVTKSHKVIWERGISSHDELYTKYVEQYPELKESSRLSAKIEIMPTKGYLYPKSAWSLEVDEEEKPDWWSASHELEAIRAMRQWRSETYALINIEEARKPFNPLSRKNKPTKKDIELLKQWASVVASVWASVGASVWASVRASVGDSIWASVVASVWASVGDSVWASVRASVGDSIWASVGDSIWASVGDSVWASVRDSVWASVGDSIWASVGDSIWASVGDSVGDSVRASVRAYIGSLFYVWGNKYKFQPCVDLWNRGFVPSFDGATWRLHSGKNAEIVYEWKP